MNNYIAKLKSKFVYSANNQTFDVRKVIALASLFFCISLVYHILRCTKVTLVVKAPGSGAEILPFLKVWVILPVSFFVTWLYTKLALNNSAKVAIMWILGAFISFFMIFTYALYPLRDYLFVDSLRFLLDYEKLSGLKGLINIIIYWPYTLFYVASELWSTLMISVLFWGFTNQITSTEEAKRSYALIAIGANVAGIFSGQMTANLSLATQSNFLSFYGPSGWDQSVFLLLSLVLALTAIILRLFMKLCDKADNISIAEHVAKRNKKKADGSVASWLALPKYANMIAAIVICYNVIHHLADVIWTHQCTERFTDAAMLNKYFGQLDSYSGMASFLIALCIFTPTIIKFGWRITALVPPVIWAITTSVLFYLLYRESHQGGYIFVSVLNMPIIDLIMTAGTMQMCLGRATKYTIFDQTKEMAYIPLPVAEQRKFKAIVDGLVSRIGKSISSIIQISLIIVTGSLDASLPYAFAIIGITIAIWLYATNALGHKYEELQSGKSSIDSIEEETANSKKEDRVQVNQEVIGA